MKTLRTLLIVLLALTESLRAWGVETMAAGAMFGAPCAAATARMAPMAGMPDARAQSMPMAGADHAARAGGGAPPHRPPCPLCGVVTATPPAAIALRPPALRQALFRHGVTPFRSAVPDALDPPPRRSI